MAAKMSFMEELTEDFCCCPICHEPYNRPKILPCLHSYCSPCLEKHINNRAKQGVFQCPMCQQDTLVSKEFLDNFFLAGLTEKVLPAAAKRNCHICLMDSQETQATSKCLDCDDYLCDECARKHCFTKTSKYHTVLTTEQLLSGEHEKEIKIKKKVFCQKHGDEELKYYCKKCEIPICRDCKAIEHDDHKCSTLHDAVEKAEPDVHKGVDVLQSQVPFYTTLTEILDQDLVNLEKNGNDINDAIENRAKKLHRLVDKRKHELLAEVAEKVTMQRKLIEAYKEEVHLATSVIQTTSEFANNILAHGQQAEILLLQHQMTSLFEELQKKVPAAVELPAEMKLEFQLNPDVEKLIKEQDGFGKLLPKEERRQRVTHRFFYKEKFIKIKDTPELKLKFDTDVKKPAGVEMTNISDMFVADYHEGSIHQYDKNGKLIDTFGKFNGPFKALPLPNGNLLVSNFQSGKLTLMCGKDIIAETAMVGCEGLAINSKNEIAVACSKQKHVTIMKQDLTIIKKIDNSNDQLSFVWPFDVAFLSDDRLVVSDEGAYNITILSPDGVKQLCYGSKGSENEQFYSSRGVCVDEYDNIIIADMYNRRIHLLNSEGKLVRHLLTEKDGLQQPIGLTINNNGDLVITQIGGEVRVYKYLD